MGLLSERVYTYQKWNGEFADEQRLDEIRQRLAMQSQYWRILESVFAFEDFFYKIEKTEFATFFRDVSVYAW